MATLLLIEENPDNRELLARAVARAGFRVTFQESNTFSADGEIAHVDGIVAGPAVLDHAEALPHLLTKPLVILDWNASIRQAVRAMRLGVADYLAAPSAPEELNAAVNDALAAHRGQSRAIVGAEQPSSILGSSAPMRALRAQMDRVAGTDAPVLISGEIGTGKAFVARTLHAGSKRCAAPFVTVSCAAIPESLIEQELFGTEGTAPTSQGGLIEAADHGTLFLDEVGELPLSTQARLLHFLDNPGSAAPQGYGNLEWDVRIVATSQLDLKQLTDQGRFRNDLYYRLDVVSLAMPPLRERGQDVLELSEQILVRVAARLAKPRPQLAAAAREALMSYRWPGNIRELENILERAAILCDGGVIDERLLAIDKRAPEVPDTAKTGADTISLEAYFLRFVRENEDHLTETQIAERLGISRKSLWERRQRFGMPRRRTRKRGPRRS